MAYESAPTNVSLVRPKTTSIPSGPGRDGAQQAATYTQVAEAPVTRTVPPLTRYNRETGLVEKMEDMGALEQPDQQPAKTQPPTKEEQDRFAKWKEEQAAKKAEREAAKLERSQKEQELGASLLKKGDLLGAAKAWGMSPADLIAFVTNGAMGIKPEEEPAPKPLTLEEKIAKLEKEKADYQAENEKWKFTLESSQWIEKNITPEFSNKEKYELLHKLDPAQVQRSVYDFMNQHYQETKEVLSVADILESIENEIYQDQERKLLELKGAKKFSKYFSPPSEEKEEASTAEQDISDWARQKTPDVKSYLRPAERDLNISQEAPIKFNTNDVKPMVNGKKSTFNLSRQERIAIAKAEMEEEERKNRKS